MSLEGCTEHGRTSVCGSRSSSRRCRWGRERRRRIYVVLCAEDEARLTTGVRDCPSSGLAPLTIASAGGGDDDGSDRILAGAVSGILDGDSHGVLGDQSDGRDDGGDVLV